MTRSNRASYTTSRALHSPDADANTSHDTCSNGPYPSRSEVAARYAAAPTPTERRRWLVIGLLADGAPLAEVVAATGYRPRTIRQIVQRYQATGPAGLVDGRQHSVGAAPLLSPGQLSALRQALQRPAPDGGTWTGPKVAEWIAAQTGKRVHRQRGWEYLRRLGGGAAPVIESERRTSAK